MSSFQMGKGQIFPRRVSPSIHTVNDVTYACSGLLWYSLLSILPTINLAFQKAVDPPVNAYVIHVLRARMEPLVSDRYISGCPFTS